MKIFCVEQNFSTYNIENLGDLLAWIIISSKCNDGASIAVCFHFGEFGFIFDHNKTKHS